MTTPRLMLTALCSMLLATACQTVPSRDFDAYEVLPGKWGWQGSTDCQEAPEEIVFSTSRDKMRLSYAPQNDAGGRELRRDAVYTVLGRISNGLKLSLDDEDRRDDAGNLVTWDAVLLSENAYCWRRSDWSESDCTKSVLRCEY